MESIERGRDMDTAEMRNAEELRAGKVEKARQDQLFQQAGGNSCFLYSCFFRYFRSFLLRLRMH